MSHPDRNHALFDIKAMFGRFTCVRTTAVLVHLCGAAFVVFHELHCCCRLPSPAPTEPAERGCVIGDVSFSLPNAEVASLLVEAMHCGGCLAANLRRELQGALAVWGPQFAEHPMWLTVSECKPHEGVIRRLAVVLGAPISTATGFSGKGDFLLQLRAWAAWYGVVRGNRALTDGRAAARAALLLKELASSGNDPLGESGSDDEGDQPGEVDFSRGTPGPSGPALGPDATLVGITRAPKIVDACRLVSDDVVIEGLLANQALVGVPKGTIRVWLCWSCCCYIVCLCAHSGTCANESVHQFFKQMIHVTSLSVDMMEARGQLATRASRSSPRAVFILLAWFAGHPWLRQNVL